ncbi:hypothetical protein FB451DRAFT_63318 [Mycena latifolia]|nr:hypothetical protein FB451DRAFT_63318 [Mycena latifolia]
MAFQTEVQSSSPTPSSTDSAPDPSSTSSDMDPTFSLSASPPLILAFLAVGIFAISMMIFFGWRRFAMGRTRWVDPTEVVLAAGDPPKLWDVWCPREKAGAAAWHTVQPLSATVWDDTPIAADNDVPRYDVTPLGAAFALLRRRYRRRRPEESVQMEAKFAGGVRPSVWLQIAVTIAMPCPPDLATPTEPAEQTLDYSIGLCELAWKKN